MHDIVEISKLLIKKRLSILTEAENERLVSLFKQNSILVDIRIEDLVDNINARSSIDKEKAWANIEKKSLSSNKKIKTFQIKRWYKYAAAAVFLGFLILNYFYTDTFRNKSNDYNNPVVQKENIDLGVGKATLTLEDGSHLFLEKGEFFQSDNAVGNGDKIIYKNNDENKKEINFHYLTIAKGRQFHLVLSDGTKVWLNSESQLKYPINFIQGQNREVELVYGEAYFDVTSSLENKGSKFIVHNRSQEIEVVGTQFNIKAYENDPIISTTLVEGEVLVKNNFIEKHLIPGNKSVLNRVTNKLKVTSVNVYDEISWKDGVFSFRDQTLEDIMKVLARWYDIKIVFENEKYKKIKYNGVFRKSKKLDEILQIIKNTNEVNYRINKKTIYMK